MKDKRQRLTMAWPYGMTADPNIYAYVINAAATLAHQYPYAAAAAAACMPNSQMTSPIGYSNFDAQRAAAVNASFNTQLHMMTNSTQSVAAAHRATALLAAGEAASFLRPFDRKSLNSPNGGAATSAMFPQSQIGLRQNIPEGARPRNLSWEPLDCNVLYGSVMPHFSGVAASTPGIGMSTRLRQAFLPRVSQ